MTKLILPVGIPGCGKTTYGSYISDANHVVGADDIRQELWPGEEYDPARNKLTYERLSESIKVSLSEWGLSVYVDNVNLVKRQTFYDIAREYDVDVHIIFFDNIKDAVRRNSQRDGIASGECRVPDESMNNMIKLWQAARWELRTEPWKTLTVVKDFYVKDLR